MRIYLAQPIDQVTQGDLRLSRWADDLTRALAELGGSHVIYRPWQPWLFINSGGDSDRWVVGVNESALRTARVAVFLLPAGIPTVGCHMELRVRARDKLSLRQRSWVAELRDMVRGEIIYTDDAALAGSLSVRATGARLVGNRPELLDALRPYHHGS